MLTVNPLTAILLGIVVVALIVVALHPRRGVLARLRAARRMSERVMREDALKYIHNCEMEGRPPSAESLAGALGISVDAATTLLESLAQREMLQFDNSLPRLTALGRDTALHILRAHRLWERYLADNTGYDQLEWHGQADRLEHQLAPDEVEALAERLDNPTYDPHGDPIPTREGEIGPVPSLSLPQAKLDRPLRITHIEDEPETVYAQIAAEGLYPGMDIRLIESTPRRVRFWAAGDQHVLAPIVASNISVQSLSEGGAPAEQGEPLSRLRQGEEGQVVQLSPACRGLERRRLLDLGLVPGTHVRAEFTGPGGDPRAYRIRGALIALRKEQADLILVQPEGSPS